MYVNTITPVLLSPNDILMTDVAENGIANIKSEYNNLSDAKNKTKDRGIIIKPIGVISIIGTPIQTFCIISRKNLKSIRTKQNRLRILIQKSWGYSSYHKSSQ